MDEILIRPSTAADLPALTEIYNHYVKSSVVTFDLDPYGVAERRSWFEQFGADGRYCLVVAESRGAVLGYASSVRFRHKRAYETSVETTVYCAPGEIGRGIGSRLYSALFEALAAEDLHRAYAGIALPNPASLALHAGFGFELIGTFREVGRKFGRYWDVTWLGKNLGGDDQ